MVPTNEFEWVSLIVFGVSTPLFLWFLWYTWRRKMRHPKDH